MYLIIIGAPRSGTNMLRDALTALPGFTTWPCDEINYIWRHGNVRNPSDALGREHATPKVRSYVRRQFEKMRRRSGASVLVEKTCANTLRVDFVDAIVPEARYIHIYRNGLDVVDSAMKRWKAKLDLPYLAAKARFVPATDLPYYAVRYAGNRLHRLFSRGKRLAFWGPQIPDMQAVLADRSLEEICAIQWRECVERSANILGAMPKSKVSHVAYENFVESPKSELMRLLAELGLDVPGHSVERAVGRVDSARIGIGRKALSRQGRTDLEPIVRPMLERLGYA